MIGTEQTYQTEWYFLNTLVEAPAERIFEMSTKVSAEDFHDSAAREIFRAIQDLTEKGETVDLLQIQRWCAENKANVNITDIARLSDEAGVLASLDTYAALIRKGSQRRRLKTLCEIVIQRLADPGITTESCIADLTDGTMELSIRRQSGLVHIRDIMPQVMDQLAMERANSGEVVGYTTGVRELDFVTGGIRDGEVWVIGALPGRGKTQFGLQLCAANAENSVPTLIFSLEMSAVQDVRRILSVATNTPATFIRDPRRLSNENWVRLAEQAAALREWPVFIDESANIRIKELLNRVRLYVRRYKVRLIVVDYIQLIQATGKDIRERVSEVSNGLRIIAKDENVAMVVLSQLRRPQDINDIPNMIQLKESGDVEANAHTVLLLYQPLDKQTAEPTGQDEIIIGKQRNGPLGTVPVFFDRKALTFKSREVHAREQ